MIVFLNLFEKKNTQTKISEFIRINIEKFLLKLYQHNTTKVIYFELDTNKSGNTLYIAIDYYSFCFDGVNLFKNRMSYLSISKPCLGKTIGSVLR